MERLLLFEFHDDEQNQNECYVDISTIFSQLLSRKKLLMFPSELSLLPLCNVCAQMVTHLQTELYACYTEAAAQLYKAVPGRDFRRIQPHKETETMEAPRMTMTLLQEDDSQRHALTKARENDPTLWSVKQIYQTLGSDFLVSKESEITKDEPRTFHTRAIMVERLLGVLLLGLSLVQLGSWAVVKRYHPSRSRSIQHVSNAVVVEFRTSDLSE